MPNPKIETIGELGDLMSIMNSVALRALLNRHKEYLQGQINRFVGEQNLMEAFGARAKLLDIDKIMELVEKRISELKKEREDGN